MRFVFASVGGARCALAAGMARFMAPAGVVVEEHELAAHAGEERRPGPDGDIVRAALAELGLPAGERPPASPEPGPDTLVLLGEEPALDEEAIALTPGRILRWPIAAPEGPGQESLAALRPVREHIRAHLRALFARREGPLLDETAGWRRDPDRKAAAEAGQDPGEARSAAPKRGSAGE